MVKRAGWSLVLVLVLNCAARGGGYEDAYMREAKQICALNSGASLACLKYEILQFLHRIFNTKRRNIQISWIKLVNLPNELKGKTNFSVIGRGSEGRAVSSSEWNKFAGFLDREVSHFVKSHALEIPLPEWASQLPFFFLTVYPGVPGPTNLSSLQGPVPSAGNRRSRARARTRGRGKGRGKATPSSGYKKLYLLFPLIAVFKFLIIKLLLIPILIGVFAIKKMLVAAAMALPTLVQLFRCRTPNPFNPNGVPGGGLLVGGLLPAAAGAALQGYAAEPLATDYSSYGYPQRLHPPFHPMLHPAHQWENLKNYKSQEHLD